MKYSELQTKSIEELRELLKNAKIKLGQIRFELANKALKDSSQIKKTRKEIAQFMTRINKKNLE